MATGRGAAFGLAFHVTAHVEDARRWRVAAKGRALPPGQGRLALRCARLAQLELGVQGPLAIDIASDIPPRRGLKSSSAVSVAVVRAVMDHQKAPLSNQRILEIASQAGQESGTSLTGAFDDAAACLLGGVVLTDNRRRKILKVDCLPPGLGALVRIPHQTLATAALRQTRFEKIAGLVDEAWTQARAGRYPVAMALNSLAYARILGHSLQFTMDALEQGAWAAGLSGKGPAEVALVRGGARGRTQARYPGARPVPLRGPGGEP
jgi:shikimate kinase